MVGRRGSRGFTLVEAVVVAGIVSLLFLGVTLLLRKSLPAVQLSTARAEMVRDARVAMNRFQASLMQARAGSVVISRADNGAPYYSQLSFETVAGETHTYFLRDRSLWHSLSGGTGGPFQQPLLRNVRYLFFGYPNTQEDRVVTVALCLDTIGIAGRRKAFYLYQDKTRILNS